MPLFLFVCLFVCFLFVFHNLEFGCVATPELTRVVLGGDHTLQQATATLLTVPQITCADMIDLGVV